MINRSFKNHNLISKGLFFQKFILLFKQNASKMVASISVILNLEVKDFFAKQKPPIAILLRTQFIATLFTLNLVPHLEQL